MGWETRNGRRYYYRKRWEGGRVVSEYVGRGDMAGLFAAMDDADAQQAVLDQEERRAEREAERAIDRQIDEACDLARHIATAALLAAGYHAHKGAWRKRRNGRRNHAGADQAEHRVDHA